MWLDRPDCKGDGKEGGYISRLIFFSICLRGGVVCLLSAFQGAGRRIGYDAGQLGFGSGNNLFCGHDMTPFIACLLSHAVMTFFIACIAFVREQAPMV